MGRKVWRSRPGSSRCHVVCEGGFSLLELVVVIAIMAVLVAVAIPIFLGIKSKAQESAVRAVAADGASAATAAFASMDLGQSPAPDPAGAAASAGTNGISAVLGPASDRVSNVCVTATDGTYRFTAGPASPSDANNGPSCP